MVPEFKTFSGTPSMKKMALDERDLRSLRVFCAAAQASGFAAAERTLFMSKASISRHINEVEARLGIKLCERGPGGFQLTEGGEVALRVSLQALEALLLADIAHRDQLSEDEGLAAESLFGGVFGIGTHAIDGRADEDDAGHADHDAE